MRSSRSELGLPVQVHAQFLDFLLSLDAFLDMLNCSWVH